jgi:DNA-binding transcriptional ArsR family regulator
LKLTKDTLDPINRKMLYEYISKYPGLHQRELCRKLNLPYSTLRYHLKYLIKRSVIKTQKQDGYVRYYIVNTIDNQQKKVLNILRQEVPRNIIIYLLGSSCASQIELSKSLEKHPTTIEFHLKKLLKMNIIEYAPINNIGIHVELKLLKTIERSPISNEKIYRLKEPYFINDTVKLYKKISIDHNYCDLLTAIHKFWSKNEKPINKSKDTNGLIDSLEEIFFEIIPHPYHV